MRRLLPSHPDWERIDRLANALAMLANPHLFGIIMTELDRYSLIATTQELLALELEAGAFRDFIEELNFDGF